MAKKYNGPEDKIADGAPRKKKKRRAKKQQGVVRASSHKARARWFNEREAWPYREPPVERWLDACAGAHCDLKVANFNDTWIEAGPSNVGGRSTSLIVHPQDPDRWLLGAAGGGVWATNDGGLSWESRWDLQPTLNIGALCLDPANPQTVYCATGEANLSADSYPGVGVYVSGDFGQTWNLLAAARVHGLPRRIGRVAVDPFDSDAIFLAGVRHSPEDETGLFVSRDRGISWARVNGITGSPFYCHEVVFHPTDPGVMYCTIDSRGSMSGIWRSRDTGRTWEHLTSGLPHGSYIRRTSLAIAPSRPQILYAQAAYSDGTVLGVYRSVNSGDTWRLLSGVHFQNERQMTYNNTIAVDPEDENVVFCGGVDLHRSTDRGNTWQQVTRWDLQRGSPRYAHADHHDLVIAHGRVHAANDGGIDVSDDGGNTWVNRSNGLATNMFYDLAVAALDPNFYGGGMQDNGTWLTVDGMPDEFIETTGGDGGFCAIDPNDPMHFFTSSQFMRINRFRNSDGWATNIGPNENDADRPWMAFIAMDPVRPRRVFTGSRRVWRSVNDGNPGSWVDITGTLDGSFVTCIEISRADSDRIYVGTEYGGIFRSDDGGASWTSDISSAMLPGRTITRLRTPANDRDVVYASIANYGHSHLYRSVDGGDNWSDVDSGKLPDAPLHAIAIPANDADRLFVAGDAGVFVSLDGAQTWCDLSLNLPQVMVVDLVMHDAANGLLAATYGRSTWWLDLATLSDA